MARTELDRTVLPSLLDRLTDEAPGAPADPPLSREASVRRHRAAVLRDVEWLLNTRRTAVPVLPSLRETARSAFTYGLPDTTGLGMAAPDGREQLVRWIEETLTLFEPRLAGVQVTLADADQAGAPQVHLTVRALLRMDPSPERVLFDTVLDLTTGGYVVAPDRFAADGRSA